MSHWPVYKSMNLRKILSPHQTKALSDSFHQFFSRYIEPFEAVMPNKVTQFPGPNALLASSQISQLVGKAITVMQVIMPSKGK